MESANVNASITMDTSGFDRAMARVKSGLSGVKAGIQSVQSAGQKLAGTGLGLDGAVSQMQAAESLAAGGVIAAYLDNLGAAMTRLNANIVALQPMGTWLGSTFLQALASWGGSVVGQALQGIATALGAIGAWIAANGETMIAVILAIGLAFAAWNAAGLVVSMTGLAAGMGALVATLLVLGAWAATGGVVVLAAIQGMGLALACWNVALLVTGVQGLTTALTSLGATLQIIATTGMPGLTLATSGGLSGIQDFAAGVWSVIDSDVAFLANLATIDTALIAHTVAWASATAAKIADKAETLALMALYAKDMIVGLTSSTASLFTNAGAWAATTGAKILDKVATVASTVATTAMSVATAAWSAIGGIATAVTAAFGVAVQIATSPVTLIILGIVALIAIIVLLIKFWPQITEAAGKALEWLKGAWITVATWFDANVIQPIARFFTGLWDSITKTFTSIGTTIGNAVGGAFKSAVNAVIGFVEGTINQLIHGINRAIGIINLIPGVQIRTLATLSIPRMAQGGVISRPTIAMIGEAGREAVVPLENNTGWMREVGKQIAAAMTGPQLAGGDITIPIYLDGNLLDEVILRAQDRKSMRTNGR